MRFRLKIGAALLALLAVGISGGAAAFQQDKPALPRVVFIKEFPGSSPAYYSITVIQNGEAVYATAPDDPQPVRFRLSAPLTGRVFQIAARLNHFRTPLETRKKTRVASMGKKTLRYEAGAQRFETSYNFTGNPDAAALTRLFEKISLTEEYLLGLERVVRFDRLGVMRQLLWIEIGMNRRDLVAPVQFVPLLEQIVQDSRFLNIAQERAAHLLKRIRNGKYSAKLKLGKAR